MWSVEEKFRSLESKYTEKRDAVDRGRMIIAVVEPK